MMTSTCPDSTCRFRNAFGFCSQTACTHSYEEVQKAYAIVNCELCKYDLDDGDYLYQRTSQDHAMVFEEVVVHYCPVCGRKLGRNLNNVYNEGLLNSIKI